MSFVYTLLMSEIAGLLEARGLDPDLGFFHEIDYGRPSLALDLLEPLRHPVADRLVLTLANRGEFKAEDFETAGESGGLFLRPAALKRFFGEYEKWMLARSAGGSFRERLRRHVSVFAAALEDERDWSPVRFLDDREETVAA